MSFTAGEHSIQILLASSTSIEDFHKKVISMQLTDSKWDSFLTLCSVMVERGAKWHPDLKSWVEQEGNRGLITVLDGMQLWLRNDQLHRDDGPAVVYSDGEQQWYQNGLLHRDDGPAIVHPDGRQFWYQNGIKHKNLKYELTRALVTAIWTSIFWAPLLLIGIGLSYASCAQ